MFRSTARVASDSRRSDTGLTTRGCAQLPAASRSANKEYGVCRDSTALCGMSFRPSGNHGGDSPDMKYQLGGNMQQDELDVKEMVKVSHMEPTTFTPGYTRGLTHPPVVDLRLLQPVQSRSWRG